jgi:adenosylcobinamide-GDP ribazoletransferase
VTRQLRLFFVATQFLTRLPTPALADFQTDWLSQSARYFPLVGALVGMINVAVWWLAHRWLPAGVAVGLMLAASMLVTGAFHEDGLADTCDGMGAGGSKERILAVMKDSRIGAFGAIGLFLVLGLKWATLTALPAGLFPLLVVSAHMVSRWCAMALIWRLPYVRDDDGKSKPFADRLSGADWLLGGTIGAAALIPVAWWSVRQWGVVDPAVLGIAAGCSAAVTALAAAYFRRRIGGYTGDCLGAVQQIAEIAFLIGGLAAAGAAFPQSA